jgi:AcrR family transcriptional regulator
MTQRSYIIYLYYMNENLIVNLEAKNIVTATFRRLHASKKLALYQAAMRTFAESTYERASIDMIAAAAGVSKGSLFQYFTSKEHLLNFICEIFIDDYKQFLQDYVNREYAVRADERIKKFFLAQIDYWSSKPVEFAFYLKMHYETSPDISRRFADRTTSLRGKFLSHVIERGARTGEIRQDINVDRISAVISLVFDGILHKYSGDLQNQRRRKYLQVLMEETISLLAVGIKG